MRIESPPELCSFCDQPVAGGLVTRIELAGVVVTSCNDCTSKGISKTRKFLQKKTPLLFGVVSAFMKSKEPL